MQTTFFEAVFNLRTREKYHRNIADLHAAPTLLHVNDIKKKCLLNTANFHVTTNCTNGIMHTVLEGIVSLEVGCIFYCLINVGKLLNLEDINEGFRLTFGHVDSDKKKKKKTYGIEFHQSTWKGARRVYDRNSDMDISSLFTPFY